MTTADLKVKTLLKCLKPINRLYYNDPPASPPVSPPPPPTVPPVSPPVVDKTFTQADVDKLMENHRKALQQRNQELIDQLEKEKQNSNLSTQQKEELETRIQTLSQQHLTKEQQRDEEYNKLKKKYETETKQLAEKEGLWKKRFEDTLIDNALATSASLHKARSATQLQLMFKNQGKVVEEVDDSGKPTGKWVAKMSVEKIDPKTQQKVLLEVPIEEAIGILKANPEFQNLFDMDGKGGFGGYNHGNGTGGGTGGSNGTPDFSKMSTEDYMKWRSKQSTGTY